MIMSEALSTTHFQSVFRRNGRVLIEPLCEQETFDGIGLSPFRADITCPACLGFLMELPKPKESADARP